MHTNEAFWGRIRWLRLKRIRSTQTRFQILLTSSPRARSQLQLTTTPAIHVSDSRSRKVSPAIRFPGRPPGLTRRRAGCRHPITWDNRQFWRSSSYLRRHWLVVVSAHFWLATFWLADSRRIITQRRG